MRRNFGLIALAVLLLAACSGSVSSTATQPPTEEPPTPTARSATATSVPTDAPTQPSPTDTKLSQNPTATEEKEERSTPTEPSVAAAQTPDTADPLAFLEVGTDEWVRGPADAPVTLIEYADFQ